MNQITQESQNIEYKQSWRDEYLKWICGFANASGGKIYIGIDDDCHVVGVPDAKKLMEDIPNKIVNYLGIVADVNLLNEEDNDYIEINVSPSSVPISYRGIYHYRSGSTKQELNGSALQHFLLKRLGRTWDDLPCEWATFDDIDKDAVAYFFKKAASAKRVANNIADDDLQTVFQNLDLVTEEGKLKNATLLLFAKRPSRFFPLVQFKIGRFGKSDDDLMFQDIVEGNILQMADKVMDILKSKYLISPIHYEGLQRIESLEIPEESLREAIFNSIIHKDYTGAPIQLSVYNDKLILWNEGRLPEGFTIGTLLGKHPSRPYNKNIADIFFKAGFIEAWGRGISKIIEGFIQEGLKTPIFEATMGGIMVTIIRSEAIASTPQVPPKYPSSTPQVIQIIGSEDLAHKLLSLFKEKEECKLADISNALGLNDRKNLRELYLKPLLEAKILELKYPDVPNHPKQMYRLVAIK